MHSIEKGFWVIDIVESWVNAILTTGQNYIIILLYIIIKYKLISKADQTTSKLFHLLQEGAHTVYFIPGKSQASNTSREHCEETELKRFSIPKSQIN